MYYMTTNKQKQSYVTATTTVKDVVTSIMEIANAEVLGS